MKSVEQIIGYLEGRLEGFRNKEPEAYEFYFIKELLNYIKEDEQ